MDEVVAEEVVSMVDDSYVGGEDMLASLVEDSVATYEEGDSTGAVLTGPRDSLNVTLPRGSIRFLPQSP